MSWQEILEKSDGDNNVVEEATDLKQGKGGGTVISGSASLVHSLSRYGLLDEVKLMIRPIVVGSGGGAHRRFGDKEDRINAVTL